MLHRLKTPGFRAINHPPSSPPQPISAKPRVCVVVRTKDVDQFAPKPSANLLAGFVGSKDSSIRKRKKKDRAKGDLCQTAEKAERASRRPKQKKKKSSDSSTTKPLRQQAPREKKHVQSIEFSPPKTTGRYSRECSTDRADEDFIPTQAELARISLSSASSPPSRGSIPHHQLSNLKAGSGTVSALDAFSSPVQTSLQANMRIPVVKREGSPRHEVVGTARPPSPSLWSSPLRLKRYHDDGVVELPKLVFDYEKGLTEYQKTKKKMRHQLATKKEAMMAGKRNEKGKFIIRDLIGETGESTERKFKRNQQSDEKPRKRQKMTSSERAGPEDRTITGNNKDPHNSGPMSARRSARSDGTEQQGQKYRAVVNKAEDREDIAPVGSSDAKGQLSEGSLKQKTRRSFEASRYPGKQIRPLTEGLRRREVHVHQQFQKCTCAMLPEYFTEYPHRIPHLRSWPGGQLEFLEHVNQISTCPGSIHPDHVIDACRETIRIHGYHRRWGDDPYGSAFESAQVFVYDDDQKDRDLRRAQSSIPPPVFYGKKGRNGPLACASKPSGFAPEVNKSHPPMKSHSTSKSVQPLTDALNSQPKSLPMRDRSQNATSHAGPSVGQHLAPTKETLPNASPLGERRRVDPTAHQLPYGQGNVGARQTPKILPEATSDSSQPRNSSDARHQRHQTVPVILPSRNINSREAMPPPLFAAPRRDDAILRRLASVEKIIQERLQPAMLTPSAAFLPAAAPTPAAASAPNTNAQTPNPTEQPRVRKRKNPTAAERQVKYPKLDRNAPAHPNLTDAQIIHIGRTEKLPYERHRKAQQAFDWNGHLYAQYRYLLVGNMAQWSHDEIKRVTR